MNIENKKHVHFDKTQFNAKENEIEQNQNELPCTANPKTKGHQKSSLKMPDWAKSRLKTFGLGAGVVFFAIVTVGLAPFSAIGAGLKALANQQAGKRNIDRSLHLASTIVAPWLLGLEKCLSALGVKLPGRKLTETKGRDVDNKLAKLQHGSKPIQKNALKGSGKLEQKNQSKPKEELSKEQVKKLEKKLRDKEFELKDLERKTPSRSVDVQENRAIHIKNLKNDIEKLHNQLPKAPVSNKKEQRGQTNLQKSEAKVQEAKQQSKPNLKDLQKTLADKQSKLKQLNNEVISNKERRKQKPIVENLNEEISKLETEINSLTKNKAPKT